MLRVSRQYSCNVRRIDSETDSLIQVLSLQVMTQSKIRLAADDLVSYRKTLTSLSQKTVSSDIFISQKIMFLSTLISKSTMYSNISEKNMIILNLIKNTQKFNLQCRQIFSQFCRKLKKNLLFVLHRNEILRKMNHVYISHQETIQNQLLKFYHDCSSENH